MISDPGQQKNRQRPLQKMFTEVHLRYDLMNRLLTWRFDERWRKKTARECVVNHPSRILDLCTGTGDLALHLSRLTNGCCEIFALDYSRPMLEIAKRKSQKQLSNNIIFLEGDAAALPFENKSFDVVGIAFAFRNLTYKNPDREIFLREILRILADHGKFVIVETSQPDKKWLRLLFHLYLRIIVAGLGGLLSGCKGAYRYLAASANHFYSPGEIKTLLIQAGFNNVLYKSLLGGIAGITTANK